MRTLLPFKTLDRLENIEVLDGVTARAQKLLRRVIRPGEVKDVLHGVPMGHPFHPLAVQLPLGAWTSAVLLDFLPGTHKSADALLAVGTLCAVPAVVSGWTDWMDLHPQQQRVGIVHAAANAAGTLLFGASLLLRTRGRRTQGIVVSATALALVGLGGTLGGHLAYRLASGANHAEEVPHLVPPGWHKLGELADIPIEQLVKRSLAEVPLLLWRTADGPVHVLSNKCSHLAGPLNEGKILESRSGPCVECPWHQSRFLLSTGEVVQGPATAPQARFTTRVVDGGLEVSLPNAG